MRMRLWSVRIRRGINMEASDWDDRVKNPPVFPQGKPAYVSDKGIVKQAEGEVPYVGGMSLLDYFLAHAPASMPEWYYETNERPHFEEGLVYAEWRTLIEAYRKERDLSWPFYWANAMLKEREKYL